MKNDNKGIISTNDVKNKNNCFNDMKNKNIGIIQYFKSMRH